jgi:hypothetical protein
VPRNHLLCILAQPLGAIIIIGAQGEGDGNAGGDQLITGTLGIVAQAIKFLGEFGSGWIGGHLPVDKLALHKLFALYHFRPSARSITLCVLNCRYSFRLFPCSLTRTGIVNDSGARASCGASGAKGRAWLAFYAGLKACSTVHESRGQKRGILCRSCA